MDDGDKTRDQLIEELEKLRRENFEITASLKSSNLGHHMEDALRESEAKYAAAFRTSPDSININTMDGVYIDINEGFTKMSGYTMEDVIDVSSFEMKIWAKPVERAHLVKVLKRKGIIENMEATFRCKDGTLKIGLMSACIISIQNVPHILSITRDISDRKLIEKKLDESERKYRLIAEHTSDGILAFGADQKISYVSPSYLKQLGYSFEDEIGNDMTAIGTGIHPEDREGLFAEILNAMDIKMPDLYYTYRVKRKDGQYIWREDHANFIYDADKNYLGTYVICRDVTERKRDEEELRKTANELKRLNGYFIDRELKMIELKKEINGLLEKLGKDPKYDIVR